MIKILSIIIFILIMYFPSPVFSQVANPPPPSESATEVFNTVYLKDIIIKGRFAYLILNDNKVISVPVNELVERGIVVSKEELENLLKNSPTIILKKSTLSGFWTLIFIDNNDNELEIEPVVPVGFIDSLFYHKNCLQIEIEPLEEEDLNQFYQGSNTIKSITFEGLLSGIELNSGEFFIWKQDYLPIVQDWKEGDKVLLLVDPCNLTRYNYILINLSNGERVYGDLD